MNEVRTGFSGTFSKKAEESVKTFLKLYDSFKKELKISKELKTFFDEESLENQGIENTEDFEKPLSHLILKIAKPSFVKWNRIYYYELLRRRRSIPEFL